MSTFGVVNLDDCGVGSLRAAILAANDNPGADVIQFAPQLEGTVALCSQLSVTDDLTIDGPGSGRITVSGAGVTRVFAISGEETDVLIDDLTIADGMASGIAMEGPLRPVALGGGILNTGAQLTLSQVVLVNNQVVAPAPGTDAGGGAIANIFGATLSVEHCTLEGNLAIGPSTKAGDSWGGAIVNDSGSTLTVVHSVFSGNQSLEGGSDIDATSFGSFAGAIANGPGCDAAISHSSFADNLARGRDGANGNPATGGRGGAIANADSLFPGSSGESTLTVSHCTFTANQAVGGNSSNSASVGYGGKALGGAVLTAGKGASTVVTSCVFTENQALAGNGAHDELGGHAAAGALEVAGAALTVVNSTFDGNEAVGGNGGWGKCGGGLAAGGAISSSFIVMYPNDLPTLDVQGCRFTGNRTIGGHGGTGKSGYNNGGIGQGGAISASTGTMNVAASSFAGNQAIGGDGGLDEKERVGGMGGRAIGGAIAFGSPSNPNSTGFVSQCTFEGNAARGGAGSRGAAGGNSLGGAIANGRGTLTIDGSFLTNNEAIGGAGGEGANGGNAQGGGLLNTGTATLTNTTIARNEAFGGAAGLGGLAGLGTGGGIYNEIALGAIISIDALDLVFDNVADLFDDCYGC